MSKERQLLSRLVSITDYAELAGIIADAKNLLATPEIPPEFAAESAYRINKLEIELAGAQGTIHRLLQPDNNP